MMMTVAMSVTAPTRAAGLHCLQSNVMSRPAGGLGDTTPNSGHSRSGVGTLAAIKEGATSIFMTTGDTLAEMAEIFATYPFGLSRMARLGDDR